jgi:hypothetical protein
MQNENDLNTIDENNVIRISDEDISSADQKVLANKSEKITINVCELPAEVIPPAPTSSSYQTSPITAPYAPTSYADITPLKKNPMFPLMIIGGGVVTVMLFLVVLFLANSNKKYLDSNEATRSESSSKSAQKQLPPELRILAKTLGAELHSSYEKAAKQPDENEIDLKLQETLIDLQKITSNDQSIQRIISDSLKNVTELHAHWEKYKSLPKPDGWGLLKVFGAGFLDGALIASGQMPTGASVTTTLDEYGKADTVDAELATIAQLTNKVRNLSYLIPKVAQEYSAKIKNNDRFEIDFCEPPTNSLDSFAIINKKQELYDCIVEVKITGAKGDVGTNIFFVDKWERNTWLYALSNRNLITATHVEQIDVTVLSPKYSTTIKYIYNEKERNKDYAEILKNVKLELTDYQAPSPGIFKDWERYASVRLNGATLGHCQLAVTFQRGSSNYTHRVNYTLWEHNTTVTITPGNHNMSFEPNKIVAEISFPRSSFKIRQQWSLGEK